MIYTHLEKNFVQRTLLLDTGNGCGYANRTYDSEGGTGSAHSVPKATVWIYILPRLDLIYYSFISCCSSRHGLLY
jgi:hypothetical protein